MLPKPSLVLQVKLLPEDYSETAVAEIKRSYMYIAQSVVSELAEDERADGNIMRLSVRLMKPYWNPADAGAEELWRQSFMPWLANATRNMSTAMHNFNTVLHPLGSGNVSYGWADYDFAPHGVMRMKVDGENRLPAIAPALIDRARMLMAEGAWDENVALIRMPSRASLAAQEEAAAAARRAAAEAAAAKAAAESASLGAPDGDAPADAGVPADGLAADAEVETEAALTGSEASPEVPAEVDEATVSFPLDYRIWGIEYADGSVIEFDSKFLF